MSVPSPIPPPRAGVRILAVAMAVVGLLLLATWYTYTRGYRSREAARAAVVLAKELLKEGRAGRAWQAVERVPEVGPWSAELLAVKGLALASFDRPDASRPLLERALKLDPNQPMVTKVLAAIYFHAYETDRGFAMLEQSARLDPTDFRPWFAAGDMVLKFRLRPSDAIRCFERALEIRPDHDESRTGLIEAYLTEGSASEATSPMEAAIAAHPDDPHILCLAARHAQLLGRPEEMNRFAERALQHDPNNLEARVLHAQYLFYAGRKSDALSDAEAAVGLDPNDLSALTILGQAEASLGMKDRSTATEIRRRRVKDRNEQLAGLMDEIKAHPGDPGPRWRMGRVAAEGGMVALAIRAYRAALTLDSRCQPAIRGLAALDSPTP